ncbi:response regulator (plasmid) [Rhizobium sp. CC1099]|uniref:response regulator transcription factor n=1 Tax=Rhizobium sp. CC1099 TaxID=3039160 RepID=UPI0024B1B841|nr:response regulator [Rhizobium sp. CC1099]WFU91383.1 response regulator [Rhizobium sp. CC1099]
MTSFDFIHTSKHRASTKRHAVIIADPDVEPNSPLVERLVANGLYVCLADTADAVRRHLRERTISYAVVELVFDDGCGIEIVESIAKSYPRCRTLVHSRFCNLSNVVAAIKSGASDVLPKPVDLDLLIDVLLNKETSQPNLVPSFATPDSLRHEHIRDVYMSCGAKVARAARQLSMHRRTLQRLLKRSPLL